MTTTGVYLGLDRLNMDDGCGMNVQIGGSRRPECLTAELQDWLEDDLWDGRDHLIRGLVDMHRVYAREEGPVFGFADYALFLGYSGFVLAAAIERLSPATRSGAKGRLYAWAFTTGTCSRWRGSADPACDASRPSTSES
jgi:hypothetical protein